MYINHMNHMGESRGVGAIRTVLPSPRHLFLLWTPKLDPRGKRH